MKTLRKVNTVCPVCLNRIEGCLLQNDSNVTIHRECVIHGVTESVLSHNPVYYAELDRFYFDVLKKGTTKGKITNYWILSTHECQMRCSYCQVNTRDPFFQDMDESDFDKIVQKYKNAKLTLSGGEPTFHPDVIYFFKHASRFRRCTQLATNGLRLADDNFYQELKMSGVKEVRVSYEMFLPVSENSKIHEFNKYLNAKLIALKHLEMGDFMVILSPTIFKGVNENLLLQTLDYAKDKYFIKEISVSGFSWAGFGVTRDKNEMIMPDEMMDIICNGLGIKNRESIFTLQKILFTFLQLLNIRICMYTQILIFVRRRGVLKLIVDYFNEKRMKNALKFWEKFNNACYIVKLFSFCAAMVYSIKLKTFLLFGDIFKLVLANIFKIDISKYPASLLPVVLNTNCSTLTADEELSKQCMSAVIYKKNGKIKQNFTAYILLNPDIA